MGLKQASGLVAFVTFFSLSADSLSAAAYPKAEAIRSQGADVILVRGGHSGGNSGGGHSSGNSGGHWGGYSRYGYGYRPSRAFVARRYWRPNRFMAQRTYPRYSWWQRRLQNSQTNNGKTAAIYVPPRNPNPPGDGKPRPTGGDGGRNPGRIPGHPIWGGPDLPPPSFDNPGMGSTTIVGFGGQRPPIAPPSMAGNGQQSSSAVAALLDNKRYRPRELLIEVANDSPSELKQTLANQYGVEVRELGVISLVNVRIWHLTLVQGQNLRAVLERLLQDNRIIRAQPNYIYTPVQGPQQAALPNFDKAALTQRSDANEPSGAGVKIAIIDTCIDRDHEEIKGSVTTFFDAMPRTMGPLSQVS